MCLDDDDLFRIFENTIHDPRPEWYVGDPCYAINNHFWQDFCDEVSKFSHDALEGTGVNFVFHGTECSIYNSGLGGDGSFTVKGLEFKVDSGMLSVLPARLVSNDCVGGHRIRSRLRPVFDTDTNNPHISLCFNGDTQFVSDGHTECDGCGEWRMDNDTWSNNDGETVCVECYEEEEEGEVTDENGIDKWLKDFHAELNNKASGLIDKAHYSMVIPRTEDARMNMLMFTGVALEEKKNTRLMLLTNHSLGSIKSKHLNEMCKNIDILNIDDSLYCSKLLKKFIKHFNRVDDTLSIYGSKDEGAPIRIISPCRDWEFLLAARHSDAGTEHYTKVELEKELW